ncbi:MAG: thioredoxin family protein [Pirellulaceae bacterium]|nr:thioredoxin family protein [Planctomycetales bacterium]MCA9208433.1 thioredoxin family protein [Planctomycetales bacterium]MCA9219517.1 thioredoxin family protein [Planctomycetales bacterium]MCA9226113.1 thioredoxin family protein [Planctomycetales bacterium]
MVRRSFAALALVAAGLLVTGVARAEKLEQGDKAPAFKATGVDGKEYSLDSAKGADAVVVCFTCNRCPVSVAYEDRFIEFTKKYSDKGVKFVAINVNRGEDLSAMKQRAEEKGFNFPYAFDESGDSARAYGARVTPHLFVLDKNRNIVFQGPFDDKMSNPSEHYVADAVDAVLSGKQPSVSEKKPFGCGIQPNKK